MNNQNNEYPDLFLSITKYSEATINLAKAMVGIKDRLGRKTLEDLTCFDTSRINSLCRLGNLTEEVYKDIIPEALLELVGEPKSSHKRLASRVRECRLKPSQLRKEIRQQNKTLVSKDKKSKVSSWGKHLLLLENELKGMDPATKQRAIAHLANTLTTL